MCIARLALGSGSRTTSDHILLVLSVKICDEIIVHPGKRLETIKLILMFSKSKNSLLLNTVKCWETLKLKTKV